MKLLFEPETSSLRRGSQRRGSLDHKEKLLEYIRGNIIGAGRSFESPFGTRRVVYADYTASGKALSFIEAVIVNEVLPLYANTHTEASVTGRHTTALREEARSIIKRCVKGTNDDAVIFAGSGATRAINVMVDILNIRVPRDLDNQYKLSTHIPAGRALILSISHPPPRQKNAPSSSLAPMSITQMSFHGARRLPTSYGPPRPPPLLRP
jgi:hypothetical protein